jgi:hypothetical protein
MPACAVTGPEGPKAVSAVSSAEVKGEAHPANTDMASSIHVPVTMLFILSPSRRAEVCCAGSCKLFVKALQNQQASRRACVEHVVAEHGRARAYGLLCVRPAPLNAAQEPNRSRR